MTIRDIGFIICYSLIAILLLPLWLVIWVVDKDFFGLDILYEDDIGYY